MKFSDLPPLHFGWSGAVYARMGCPECGWVMTLPSDGLHDTPWCHHRGSYSWHRMGKDGTKMEVLDG